MHLTAAGLGVVLLLLFGLFYYLRIFAKARALLALTGTVAVGLTGTVGRIAGDIAGWAQHAAGAVTAWAFGASLSAGLFIILAALLVHDLHPRKSAGRRTGYIALAVGILLVAGVSQFPALAPAVSGIRSLLSGAANFINTL